MRKSDRRKRPLNQPDGWRSRKCFLHSLIIIIIVQSRHISYTDRLSWKTHRNVKPKKWLMQKNATSRIFPLVVVEKSGSGKNDLFVGDRICFEASFRKLAAFFYFSHFWTPPPPLRFIDTNLILPPFLLLKSFWRFDRRFRNGFIMPVLCCCLLLPKLPNSKRCVC